MLAVSKAAAPSAASAVTTTNCAAVKQIGRPREAARPVMTTCAAQKTAESATSRSPDEKAANLPPPSSHVPSADSATAAHTIALGTLPLEPQTNSGVMTT